ncbi:hypothetical protein B9Z55_006479 [Caenorhabditis nigoni]|nr:hypothetical protein B9Z55_006479 [Caenorhabditis nigoni]
MEPCFKMCYPARCQCPEHKGYGRNIRGECVYCPETDTKLIDDWIDVVTPEGVHFVTRDPLLYISSMVVLDDIVHETMRSRDDSLDDYHSSSADDMLPTVSTAFATP